MNDGANTGRTVSVVIPILNAARYLPELLRVLKMQQPTPPAEIILVDSASTDRSLEIAQGETLVRVIPIDNFTHGRSRNMGARAATGDIIVLMTQDALPRDSTWLATLIEPLGRDGVVASFSRQVPRSDARPMECYYLQTQFPDGAPIYRRKRADAELALADIFFSNVSSAVLRETLMQYPFDDALIMGEDQKLAKDLLLAGHTTAYQPDSVVVHSHAFSLLTVFRRYFDSVYTLSRIVDGQNLKASAAIGRKYVKEEIGYVARHHPLWLPYYCLYTGVKVAATILAHQADHLPKCVLRKISFHHYHWA